MRLLKIELFKLWHNRISKILIFGYFLLIFSIAILSTIKIEFGPINFYLAEQGIFNFPYIWHFNTFMIALFKVFFAIIIVAMIGNEYSNKTLKQNLIDGLSKAEFLRSKIYAILAFVFTSTLLVFIISLILGGIYSDYDELPIIFTDLEYLVAYAVKLFGFFTFCLFLSILIKKSAFSLGFLALWQVIEGIIFGLMKWKLSDLIPQVSVENLFQFFPLNALGNLIKEPFSRLSAVQNIADKIGEGFTKDYSVSFLNIVIVLIWSGLFIYGSYLLLKKRDL
ncbi:MAG: ABC transporter permease [Flavobacteriales bacterium]|jgi:ABC-type transport system involved in multi-copper enzyme maturation permease subunit|tara:strand:+ start:331 stop:1170 length:840 start_codon:yes stop_codon:yes gene_type:complete